MGQVVDARRGPTAVRSHRHEAGIRVVVPTDSGDRSRPVAWTACALRPARSSALAQHSSEVGDRPRAHFGVLTRTASGHLGYPTR